MNNLVKVSVLRKHTGSLGPKKPGDSYEVTAAHAGELVAAGLVKVEGEPTEEAPAADHSKSALPKAARK